jgi:hypothetical protein
LNLNHRQLIEPYPEHDVFDYKQDHDIYEHGDIHYDEDKSKARRRNDLSLKWVLYECTLEDVSISIVVFSKTVRDADN